MIQIFSSVNKNGQIVFRALTGYGSTLWYECPVKARLAGIEMIKEAQ